MLMLRLSELRAERGLSQRAMAKALNISQGTYNNWENSNTQPSIEQLIALANFFEVSVDYLIGNTDELGGALPIPLTKKQWLLLRSFDNTPIEIQDAIITILSYHDKTNTGNKRSKKEDTE